MESFREAQRAAGARWEENRPTPADYGDPSAEYRASRQACAIIDLTQREHIEITGEDRTTFLNNFCTADIKQTSPGQGGEAFVTDIKGHIIGYPLYFVGRDAIWLDCDAGSARKMAAHLDRYIITEDVVLSDRSEQWKELALIGPTAVNLVSELLPEAVEFTIGDHASFDGGAIRRLDMTRSPGWLIGTTASSLRDLWTRLVSSGAVPCGDSAFDALRIEACFPKYGVDITEENLAHEAGRTAQAISFTKGCYLGQEPIARLESMGHTNRELRGIRLDSQECPKPGAEVTAGEDAHPVGKITSVGFSPTDRQVVALAMLRREVCAPESRVSVELPQGERCPGTVFA